jgi:Transposase DDE domain
VLLGRWGIGVDSHRVAHRQPSPLDAAIQLTRRTRPASRNGKWRTETVYAITDLRPHQARPDELAAWIRGHWQIENALHWVRDVTFAEDLSQVRNVALAIGDRAPDAR